MNDLSELVKDPVCEMMVKPGENEAVHQGLHYAFCSLQCRERFIARPGLYIGARRSSAPKQRGVKLMRQQRILLNHSLTPEETTALVAALREMMGVVEVAYRGRQVEGGHGSHRPQDSSPTAAAGAEIEISYDLIEATVAQLERRIAEVGGQLRDGSAEKLRRDFVHYIEECELQDIESGEAMAAGRRARRRKSSERAVG